MGRIATVIYAAGLAIAVVAVGPRPIDAWGIVKVSVLCTFASGMIDFLAVAWVVSLGVQGNDAFFTALFLSVLFRCLVSIGAVAVLMRAEMKKAVAVGLVATAFDVSAKVALFTLMPPH